MKKLILLVLVYGFLQNNFLKAQCPPSHLTITTQAQVDNFATDYPGCTMLPADLRIEDTQDGNSDITNLNGLSVLTEIAGDLKVSDNPLLDKLLGLTNVTSVGEDVQILLNPQLNNLVGLNNLATIGDDFQIVGNSNLQSAAGMFSITTINGSLSITNNDMFTSLTAFSNITTLPWNLTIEGNAILASLNGLQSVTSVGQDVIIDNNAMLTNIDAISNIETIGEDLSITNNANLADCCGVFYLLFEDLMEDVVVGNISISNNTGNCTSNLSILLECAPPCPIGDVTINSQADVDNFMSIFPGCTDLLGNLFIIAGSTTDPITDLSLLHVITSVAGDLVIDGNQSLTNLNGLESLMTIGGNVQITNNPLLGDCCNLFNLFNTAGTLGSVIMENNVSGCNYIGNVLTGCGQTPSQNFGVVPTMSQWGLFLFALLMITLGCVFVFNLKHQLLFAGNANKKLVANYNPTPFDKELYIKVLQMAWPLILGGFTLIVLVWGEVVIADFFGIAISYPIICYLLHLSLLMDETKSEG